VEAARGFDMTAVVCRALPLAAMDGVHNMAADETLLESAVAGVASLRFYTWSKPTVSLGYFQAASLRLTDSLLSNLPWVRHPSGGAALIHDRELTYALALPAGRPWQTDTSWLSRMHAIIRRALAELAVRTELFKPACVEASPFSGLLCFQHFTACDLMIQNAKVVGSAQRRQRGALMQHGGILLNQSPYTPVLPGIRELSGQDLSAAQVAESVWQAIAEETGWTLEPEDWTDQERERLEVLACEKYGSDAWNRKR
jgi:lipoyl(octanoyl) transferase